MGGTASGTVGEAVIIVVDTSATNTAFDAVQSEHDCVFTLDQRDFRAVESLAADLKAFRIRPADC